MVSLFQLLTNTAETDPISWTFTTEPTLKGIRLLTQLYQSSTHTKRMVALSRQNNLFAELKAKIAAKMKIQPTLINQMFISHEKGN
jgi:hypothetical protein